MANIYRVSHILPTYFPSLYASEIKVSANIGDIVRDKCVITSLSLA